MLLVFAGVVALVAAELEATSLVGARLFAIVDDVLVPVRVRARALTLIDWLAIMLVSRHQEALHFVVAAEVSHTAKYS